MKVSWTEQVVETPRGVSVVNNTDCIAYVSECDERSDQYICNVIGESVEKAVELLPLNVGDDSRYLLFEWNVEKSALSISVTDDSKSVDSARIVRSVFPALNKDLNGLKQRSAEEWQLKAVEYQQSVKYWVRDYLTTCGGFMRFSLVAVFCSESRANAALL